MQDNFNARPEVIRRKAATDENSAREKFVDFLKSSAIITDKFTGSFTAHFNQGGMVRSEKHESNPI